MQRHKIVRKASVGALLFLPLVAIGIALALMLSLGHQGTPVAQADTTSSIDISITTSNGLPGSVDCTTPGKAGMPGKPAGSKCSYLAGSGFDLGMDINDVTGVAVLQPGYASAQVLIAWDGTIVGGPAPGNGKALRVNPQAGCGIVGEALEPAGIANSGAVACNAELGFFTQIKLGTGLPITRRNRPDLPPGTLVATAEFNCLQEGTGFIILINALGEHPVGASSVIDEFGGQHFDKNGSEVLEINCLPPDEEININVNHLGSGAKQEGTCWRISYGPAKVQHDVVGDDTAGVKPDCGEPSNQKLFDKDPLPGVLSITITGAQRVQFGDIWHVQNSFSPVGKPDPNNYECDLSQGKCTIPKVAVGGLSVDLAGDETGLPLEAAQSSGTSAGLLAGIVAGISAVAITVTGAAWYARRRLFS